MMAKFKLAAIMFFLTLISLPSHAMSIYSLKDVAFEGGGTATGSFTYDAGSNSFSNILLETTAGSGFSGESYSNFQAGNENTLQVTNGSSVLQLAFVSSLTNTGGTIALGTSIEGRDALEGICSGSIPCRSFSSQRSIVAGAVTTDMAVALAEPQVWPLLIIGFVAIFFLNRQKANWKTRTA